MIYLVFDDHTVRHNPSNVRITILINRSVMNRPAFIIRNITAIFMIKIDGLRFPLVPITID